MAFIPVPNVLQVEIVYNWDGVIAENVFHLQPDGAIDPTEVAELGAALVSWWNTEMKASVPSTLSLINIKMTDLSTATAPVYNYATGLPLAGTHASPSLPNNVALVITKRTAMRGKSFRGRLYHPGLVESGVTGNTVATGTVSALINKYMMLRRMVLTSESWTMGVVSRYADKAPRVEGVFTPVTSMDSDGRVDSQRRRLPGRGQ